MEKNTISEAGYDSASRRAHEIALTLTKYKFFDADGIILDEEKFEDDFIENYLDLSDKAYSAIIHQDD